MQITRRTVLIGGLAGGGLVIGYYLRAPVPAEPLSPSRDEVVFDAWIRVARDGMITVAVPQLEMGQGITTLLPQIVAQELGADWQQIAVEPVPPSAAYANLPLMARWRSLWMPMLPALARDADSQIVQRYAANSALMITADGTALEAYEAPARHAAASLRALLAMAAAKHWDVDWKACKVGHSFVVHGDQKLAFKDLVDEAAQLDPPDSPPLMPEKRREVPSQHPIGSKSAYPRLDLPSKVNGSFVFASDVRLPDMVYAAIRHGPIGDSRLASFDPKGAQGVAGFIALVKSKRWLAAVATNTWAAERALLEIAPTFDVQYRADSGVIEARLNEALEKGQSERLFELGDPNDAFKREGELVARYDVAPAVHASLETPSATVRITSDRVEVWAACQVPQAVRAAVADTIGYALHDVVLYPMPAGGSFDRRLEHEHVLEAVAIAQVVKRPVQLTWSRWQEQVAGLPRAPVAATLSAKTGITGDVTCWQARVAVPPVMQELGARLFDGKTAYAAMRQSEGKADALAIEGAIPPYRVEHMAIDHVPCTVDLPVGRMRGQAHGYTAFFNESFVDELARKSGREALSYRIAMLGHDPRMVQCLQTVASMADWDGGLDSSGQGLACHVQQVGSREGRIAVIATANRSSDGVRVSKVSAAVDIGRIINTDIARQQIEGGLLYGLGLALGSSVSYRDGLPDRGRLRQLDLPVLADCPQIHVEFMDSEEEPADPSDLGVAAMPPALANALFSATGVRFRRLPLLSEDI